MSAVLSPASTLAPDLWPAWLRWPGATAVCIGSGPSLTKEDVDACRGRARVIVVNSTFRLAPWADVCYTNDDDWLELHLGELRDYFEGQIWCGHPTWRSPFVHPIPFTRDAPGIVTAPGHLAWGMNSGAAALNLAVQFGARRVVLLGYDQQWRGGVGHWHGPHPPRLQNRRPGFHRWAAWFNRAALDLKVLGVDCVNASRETSLRCFRRASLQEALCE